MLYGEVIRERWRRPRFRGAIAAPDAAFEDVNPLCGDRIRIECRVDAGRLVDARFTGDSCAIAAAAADVLIEMTVGEPACAIAAIEARQLVDRLGGQVRPSRLRCVTLPLGVLQGALKGHEVAP